MNFRLMHQQDTPLIICNVWDVKSATIAEQAGYTCLGTSSAAIASSFGYPLPGCQSTCCAARHCPVLIR